MTESEKTLALKIKIKFGTAPNEPNPQQLAVIKKELGSLVKNGKTPTEEDWRKIVGLHCPGAGKFFYGGADNSDLTTLLKLATNNSKD